MTKKISASLISFAAVMLGAFPALAQGVTTSVSGGVTTDIMTGGTGSSITPSVSASAQAKANVGARLPVIIARGDTDIAARIKVLDALNARVQEMKHGSDAQKAAIAAEIQANINGLTSLKAKIDADTDTATARSDSQSIFNAYRIYALLVPQSWILAAGDRVVTVAGLMEDLGAKIQTRITAAQSAGADVSAFAAVYADMNAKIADAKTQAAAAQAGVSGLTPDQGDKTKATANRNALIAARADLKTATKDLQAARADIKTIVQGLLKLDANASASATASTTVSQ